MIYFYGFFRVSVKLHNSPTMGNTAEFARLPLPTDEDIATDLTANVNMSDLDAACQDVQDAMIQWQYAIPENIGYAKPADNSQLVELVFQLLSSWSSRKYAHDIVSLNARYINACNENQQLHKDLALQADIFWEIIAALNSSLADARETIVKAKRAQKKQEEIIADLYLKTDARNDIIEQRNVI